MEKNLIELFHEQFNSHPEGTEQDFIDITNTINQKTGYTFEPKDIKPHYYAHYKLKEQIRKKNRNRRAEKREPLLGA